MTPADFQYITNIFDKLSKGESKVRQARQEALTWMRQAPNEQERQRRKMLLRAYNYSVGSKEFLAMVNQEGSKK